MRKKRKIQNGPVDSKIPKNMPVLCQVFTGKNKKKTYKDLVKDHCPITEKCLGAVHNECNLKLN